MSHETLLTSVDAGLARVTLNRPEVRNALSRTMLRELAEVLATYEADPDVRVIVLSGSGDRAFCAGADLKGTGDRGTTLEARESFGGLARILEAIPRMRTPVIAQVHGPALAGGCGLAVGCDLVVAAEDATFGLPEIRVGVLPLVVMAPILRATGRKRGLRLVLSGEPIGAAEALDLGLVSHVVPRADLAAATERVARQIAQWSPAAVAIAKEAASTMDGMSYEQALRYLKELTTLVFMSEDAREGIAAFFEKRAPRWQGR